MKVLMRLAIIVLILLTTDPLNKAGESIPAASSSQTGYLWIVNQRGKIALYFAYQEISISITSHDDKLPTYIPSFPAINHQSFDISEEGIYPISSIRLEIFSSGVAIIHQNFCFVYFHSVTLENLQERAKRYSDIAVLMLPCIDEAILNEPFFQSKIHNIIIYPCVVDTKTLELLYERVIDLYVISNNYAFLIREAKHFLIMNELPLVNNAS